MEKVLEGCRRFRRKAWPQQRASFELRALEMDGTWSTGS